jgi:hypothetical protein
MEGTILLRIQSCVCYATIKTKMKDIPATRLLRMKDPIFISNACRVCHGDVARALKKKPMQMHHHTPALPALRHVHSPRHGQVPAFCILELSPELLLCALTIALDDCLEYMNKKSKVKKKKKQSS